MSGRLVHELEYHYSDGAFGDEPDANITIRYYRKMDRFAKYKLSNNSNFTVLRWYTLMYHYGILFINHLLRWYLKKNVLCYYEDFLFHHYRRQGRVNHCRIKSKQERGEKKYFLIDNLSFDSLYSLITHYRQHPFRSNDFKQVLTEPVPQPQSHEGKV